MTTTALVALLLATPDASPPAPAPERALRLEAAWGDTRLKAAWGASALFTMPGPGWLGACGPRAIYVWDWKSGDEVAAFSVEANDAELVATPDGRILVAQRKDGETAVFDLRARRLVRTLAGGQPIFVSADGGLLATFDHRDSIYRLWDLRTGAVLWQRKGLRPDNRGSGFVLSDRDIGTLRPSPDGRLGASFARGNGGLGLKVWDLRTLAPLHFAALTEPYPSGLAFAPGGRRLLAGGAATVLWDFEEAAPPRRILLESAPRGEGAIVSPGQDRVVLWTSHDLGVWELAGGRRLWTAKRPEEQQQGAHPAAAFSPDGRFVVASRWGSEEHLVVWEAATGRKSFARGALYAELDRSVAFDVSSPRIAVAGPHSSVSLLALATGEEGPPRALEPRGAVLSLALSRDGRLLASGSGDGAVALWNGATGVRVGVLRHPAAEDQGAVDVAFSPAGTELTAVVESMKARRAEVWNVATGGHLRTITVAGRYVPERVRILPGGERVLIEEARPAYVGELQDGGHIMTRFAVATGAKLATWRTRRPPGDDALLGTPAPDAGWAVTSSYENGLWMADLQSGSVLKRFRPKDLGRASLALSTDARLVAASGDDGTTTLLSTRSGKALQSWKGPAGAAPALAFSPHARWLAAADWVGAVRIWRVDGGTLAATFDLGPRTDHASALLFTPDGARLLVGTARGQVLVLALDGDLRGG
jgi:WD40 repeat protein